MKLVNETAYDTRALRTLFCAVHERLAKAEGRLRTWDILTVAIVNTRQQRSPSGLATYEGTWCRVRINKVAKPHQVAAVMEHELLHNYGYRHRQMQRGGKRWWAGLAERFAWAEALFPQGLPLKVAKPRKVVSLADRQDAKYEKLCLREKRLVTKVKRLQTLVAKIRKSKRYYERQAAARPAPPKEHP